MTASEPVYVVSGLPRSGTSMMMRMLEAGGLPVLRDDVRRADRDNVHGYYELEAVKRTDEDSRWLDDAANKVVKVISELLRQLPADRSYRVIFMRRNLDEVLASQRQMLIRRGEEHAESDAAMKQMFVAHLDEIETWLKQARHMEVLYVSYNRMVQSPADQAARVNAFLGGSLDVAAMTAVVDPALHRQRSSASPT